jgi:tyrosine-protein kinase Etk/Wzc
MMPQNQEEEHKAGMEKQEVKQDDEINRLDYIIVLLKRKKLIAGVTLAFAVISVVVSIIMTPIFRAETRILPPQGNTSSIAAGMLGQGASGLAGITGGSFGL